MKRIVSLLSVLAVLALAFAALPMNVAAAGKGDFNGDGKVNTNDVRGLLRMVTKGTQPTQQQLWWGDYNLDDELTTSDARELLRVTMTSLSDDMSYATPTSTDWWGDTSISLLGDSISFGVGTSDSIAEHSYVSYVKKAVQAANGGNMNYGFTSAYPTAWTSPKSEEIHAWPERSTKTNADGEIVTAWTCDGDEDGNRLISVGMTATSKWATLTYSLREEYADSYDYFCVYYHTEPGAGSFAIADGSGGEVADINGSKQYISADNTVSETKRSAFYRLSDCPDGKIRICAGGNVSETSPITITGIGYYKNTDADTVTFNSYTRGGISLVNMSDTVLDQVASSETMILGIGYNDGFYNYNRVLAGEFTDRIDYLIEAVNKNGTKLIVNNYVWNNPTKFEEIYGNSSEAGRAKVLEAMELVRSELKRLAKETNGIYIDQQAVLGDAILEDLNSDAADGVHPSDAGHKMMAKNIVEAMGLAWTEDWT